jgi:hypothetical protein
MMKRKMINIKGRHSKETKMKRKNQKKKKILLLIFTISQRMGASRLIPEDHRNNKKWL